MQDTSYKRCVIGPKWVTATKRSLDKKLGIPAVVKGMQPLADWEALRGAPSGRAEDELGHALQIAATEYDNPLVRSCLARSREIIEAGSHDRRWDTWWALSRNVEHGRFVSTGEFARAWAADDDLNATTLRNAANEVLKGALKERPTWSELAQCEYVDGVQLLILAGELQAAEHSLRIERPFTRVRQYWEWNTQLLGMLPAATTADISSHVDPFFDKVRDPTFRPSSNETEGNIVFGVPLLRLRLALIRWIYIERKPIAGNWRHIIGQIGY